jgi:dihydroorotate dehydrogenase
MACRSWRCGPGWCRCPARSPRPGCTPPGRHAAAEPVGLAAGYDKNATAIAPLSRAGFGFVEVGAATPLPQPGNPKPRLFRLTEDRAAINRFGFNNDGAESIGPPGRRHPGPVPVGLNLGANKTSDNRAADFARVLAPAARMSISPPSMSARPTPKTARPARGRRPGRAAGRGDGGARRPARADPGLPEDRPDLTDDDLAQIAEVALASGLSGIIATNTTLSREGLKSASRGEAGGLSGAPCSKSPHACWRSFRT